MGLHELLMKRLEYFYLIRHKESGKFYAGSRYSSKQFIHPDQLWNSKWNHNAYFTSSSIIRELRKTDGDDAFEICYVSPRPNDDAQAFESAFLKSVNAAKDSGWINMSNGDSNFRCSIQRPESRLKISMASRNISQEIRLKLSIAGKGKITSPETREKMRIAALSRSDDIKNLIASKRIGKLHSDESKLKMSLAKRNMSDETRLKMSLARQGTVASEETKCKMRNAVRKKPKPRPITSCPHCNKFGDISNMMRWHFDKCKYNLQL